jgi:hypothetical protein
MPYDSAPRTDAHRDGPWPRYGRPLEQLFYSAWFRRLKDPAAHPVVEGLQQKVCAMCCRPKPLVLASTRMVGEPYTNPGRAYTVGELAGLPEPQPRPPVRCRTSRPRDWSDPGARGGAVWSGPTTPPPVFRPLRELMAKVYGVPAVVRDAFGRLGGRVVIFGSWAARWPATRDRHPTTWMYY